MSKKENTSTENNTKKETVEETVQSIIEYNQDNNPEPNHVSKKSWKMGNFVIAVAAAGILAGCALYSTLHPVNQNSLQVVDRTIELGTKLDTLYDPQYWVKKGEDFSGATVAIQQKDKMRKEYLPVGTYNVVITKDKKDSKCQLKVEDTVAPVFTKTTETITLTVGDKLDIKDYFHAKDLAKVDYSYNLKSKSSSKKVDTTKEGKTDIVVTAKDASGNKTSIDCTVEVAKHEKKQEKTEDKKPAKDDASSGTASNSSSSSSNTSSNLGSSTSGATVSGGASSSSSSSKPAQSAQQPSNNTSSSTNNTQQPQPQPEPQPEPTPAPAPVCEPVPAGAYTDYYAANEAAKQALNNAFFANGWNNGHYGVDTHQTNCGTIYYTYWYKEFVGSNQ